MVYGKLISGNENLDDVFFIRKQVFQIEQGVEASIEVDGKDEYAIHGMVYSDIDKKNPIGTGRILFDGEKCSIGRVAILKEYRGLKYGDFIVKLLLNKAFNSGIDKVYIHSQISAKGFYEQLGFISVGDIFLEAGIEHVEMYFDCNLLKNNCCNKK